MDNFDFYRIYRIGQDIAYKIPKSKINFIRGLIIAGVIIGVISLIKVNASALTYSTYDNTFSNNTQAVQLESLIPKDFSGQYVIFRPDDTHYCLAYGSIDDSYNGIGEVNIVTYSYNYSQGSNYTYSTDSNFKLNPSKVIVSNIENDKVSYSVNYETRKYNYESFMLVCVFLPLIFALNLRGVIKNEYV